MNNLQFSNPCLGRIVASALPSGPSHLGHWLGALQHWVRLQEQYECIFVIADLSFQAQHPSNPDQVRQNVMELLADWLSAGISPNHSLIVLQSAIPAHTQLANLLSQVVSLEQIHRAQTGSNLFPADASLSRALGPLYQATDILLYQADFAPALEQDLPVIALTQEISRRFNRQHGIVFAEPHPILYNSPHLMGLDGRPINPAHKNTILLSDSEEETLHKIMHLSLFSTGLSPEESPLQTYLSHFCQDQQQAAEIITGFEAGALTSDSIRHKLAEIVNERLHSLRVKRGKWLNAKDELQAILRTGSARAMPLAKDTLRNAYQKLGLGA